MSDDRLDRLIDDVARQMTAGQPSSDFRARVIASLDRRPRRVWRPMWIVVPLVATAAIVLAVAVARPFKGRDRGVESPAAQQSSQAGTAETAAIPPTASADATPVEKPNGTKLSNERRAYRPSDATVAVDALAPPRLELTPISVRALGVDRLPTESIAITELDAITPIAVEPLPSDDGRPEGSDQQGSEWGLTPACDLAPQTVGRICNSLPTTEGERLCVFEQYSSPL